MSVSILPQGSHFTRIAIAIAQGKGQQTQAHALAANLWGEGSPATRILKAAVGAGSIRPAASWGSAFQDYESAAKEFFSLVKQASIIGRLTGLRRVPLSVRMVTSNVGTTAYWVGRGAAVPVTNMSFAADTLDPLKLAAVIVLSDELLRTVDPAGEALIRADLVRACAEALDGTFIDPENAGVADVSPAAVTHGVTPIISTGSPADDLAALIEAFPGDLLQACFVTDPVTATQMALKRDSGGGYAFPDLGPRGGSVLNMPVITSRSSPRDSAGGQIVLLDASGIAYGDAEVRIETSQQASIQMLDGPTNNSETPTATTLVSLWQTNSAALKVTAEANWKAARTGSVALLTGASY